MICKKEEKSGYELAVSGAVAVAGRSVIASYEARDNFLAGNDVRIVADQLQIVLLGNHIDFWPQGRGPLFRRH